MNTPIGLKIIVALQFVPVITVVIQTVGSQGFSIGRTFVALIQLCMGILILKRNNMTRQLVMYISGTFALIYFLTIAVSITRAESKMSEMLKLVFICILQGAIALYLRQPKMAALFKSHGQ